MPASKIQTIRRNTKRYQQILETAMSCRCYSLNNYFNGEDINELVLVEYMTKDGRFASSHSRLTDDGSGTYTLHIHSNLWFSFQAKA